jgi:hypothetical protein
MVGRRAMDYWSRHKWDDYHLPMFDDSPLTEEEKAENDAFNAAYEAEEKRIELREAEKVEINPCMIDTLNPEP